jgi:DNA-binding response OmpR family regulator
MIQPEHVAGEHFTHSGLECSILVVEGEDGFRPKLGQALALLGHRVTFADSGEKALARLVATRYNALLLDLQTPGLDGLTVLSNARRLYPDLAIVVITDCPASESALAAVRLRVSDYLCRPIGVTEAVSAVARALSTGQWHYRQQALLDALAQAAEAFLPAADGAVQPPLHDSTCAGHLVLDLEGRTLRSQRAPDADHLELSNNETQLLAGLMAQPGRAVSTPWLARQITGQELDPWTAASIVRPTVFRLRGKLSAHPYLACSIRTARNSGYRLCVE